MCSKNLSNSFFSFVLILLSGLITSESVAQQGTQFHTSLQGVPVVASHDLAASISGPKNLYVIVHGTNRNYEDYFSYARSALRGTNLLSRALIVAPGFVTFQDEGRLADGHYWTNAGWKEGQSSLDLAGRSSFEVMDAVVTELVEAAPEIDAVYLIGHSAGGQFLQRFSALTTLRTTLKIPLTIAFLNPGSYVYPTEQRPVENDGSCTGYNRYKYGLNNFSEIPNPGAKTESAAIADLISGCSFLAVGTLDRFNDDLDQGCEANLQGEHRLARARGYIEIIAEFLTGLEDEELLAEATARFKREAWIRGDTNDGLYGGRAPTCLHSARCMLRKTIQSITRHVCTLPEPEPNEDSADSDEENDTGGDSPPDDQPGDEDQPGDDGSGDDQTGDNGSDDDTGDSNKDDDGDGSTGEDDNDGGDDTDDSSDDDQGGCGWGCDGPQDPNGPTDPEQPGLPDGPTGPQRPEWPDLPDWPDFPGDEDPADPEPEIDPDDSDPDEADDDEDDEEDEEDEEEPDEDSSIEVDDESEVETSPQLPDKLESAKETRSFIEARRNARDQAVRRFFDSVQLYQSESAR